MPTPQTTQAYCVPTTVAEFYAAALAVTAEEQPAWLDRVMREACFPAVHMVTSGTVYTKLTTVVRAGLCDREGRLVAECRPHTALAPVVRFSALNLLDSPSDNAKAVLSRFLAVDWGVRVIWLHA